MSRPALILTALLLALAAAALGYGRGLAAGRSAEQAAHNAQELARLSHALGAHQALIEQSQRASAALRWAVAAQAQLDTSTTRELAHALSQTAHQRADCRLDAGLMRQLGAALERAQRAAAGGLAHPLSAPAAGGQP